MRLVVQRVLRAKLTSGGTVVSEINNGLFVLCGITHGDNQVDIDYLVPKLLKTKLWGSSDNQAWKSSVVDMKYQILFVSQFTLYHQLKGTRPDFHDAADHEVAKALYNTFLTQLEQEYVKMADCPVEKCVQPGSFGNYMNIETVCDGPVTLVIESVKDAKAVQKYESMLKRQARESSKKDKTQEKPKTEIEEQKQD